MLMQTQVTFHCIYKKQPRRIKNIRININITNIINEINKCMYYGKYNNTYIDTYVYTYKKHIYVFLCVYIYSHFILETNKKESI